MGNHVPGCTCFASALGHLSRTVGLCNMFVAFEGAHGWAGGRLVAHDLSVRAGVGQAPRMDSCLDGLAIQAEGSTHSTASIQVSSTMKVISPMTPFVKDASAFRKPVWPQHLTSGKVASIHVCKIEDSFPQCAGAWRLGRCSAGVSSRVLAACLWDSQPLTAAWPCQNPLWPAAASWPAPPPVQGLASLHRSSTR